MSASSQSSNAYYANQPGIDLLNPEKTLVGSSTYFGKYTLGSRVHGSRGTEWIYVKSSGAAIRQYDVVAVDDNFNAASVTSTLTGKGYTAAVAQCAFTSNQFGWVACKGLLTMKVASSCQPFGLLYVGNTGISAGVADDASVTGRVTLYGVTTVQTNASNSTKNKLSLWTSAFFKDI